VIGYHDIRNNPFPKAKTHGFLPPHTGPTVIAKEFGANIGEVLLYVFIISIPTVIIAGPLFTKREKK
jgi:GntP family gluconate:H+ symporter